jgi:hypothetical protein
MAWGIVPGVGSERQAPVSLSTPVDKLVETRPCGALVVAAQTLVLLSFSGNSDDPELPANQGPERPENRGYAPCG